MWHNKMRKEQMRKHHQKSRIDSSQVIQPQWRWHLLRGASAELYFHLPLWSGTRLDLWTQSHTSIFQIKPCTFFLLQILEQVWKPISNQVACVTSSSLVVLLALFLTELQVFLLLPWLDCTTSSIRFVNSALINLQICIFRSFQKLYF